jgi:hypothetical protein
MTNFQIDVKKTEFFYENSEYFVYNLNEATGEKESFSTFNSIKTVCLPPIFSHKLSFC